LSSLRHDKDILKDINYHIQHKRYAGKIRFNEKNINAYLPMAYGALREMMEAICISANTRDISTKGRSQKTHKRINS
jgi:hypothetical protein